MGAPTENAFRGHDFMMFYDVSRRFMSPSPTFAASPGQTEGTTSGKTTKRRGLGHLRQGEVAVRALQAPDLLQEPVHAVDATISSPFLAQDQLKIAQISKKAVKIRQNRLKNVENQSRSSLRKSRVPHYSRCPTRTGPWPGGCSRTPARPRSC